ncbi:MAG TPA: ATP-binding protein [Polyangiaceae bacterium]|nr:ATP-binding protein [Polyangiaceae bacterium]
MATLTLGQRLLLATGLLSVAATTTLGYGLRTAFRRTEEELFANEFSTLLKPLSQQLEGELSGLGGELRRHCQDPLLDQALLGLSAGDLDSRRVSIVVRVPEFAKALQADELWLVTHRGEVIGAHDTALAGQRSDDLVKRLQAASRGTRLVASGASAGAGLSADVSAQPGAPHSASSQPKPLTSTKPRSGRVEAGCIRSEPGHPERWVGLLAVRSVEQVLARIGNAYGLELALRPATAASEPGAAGAMTRHIELSAFPGSEVQVRRSRVRLTDLLGELDTEILAIGGATLCLALLGAVLLSRGLARPLVELSRQASERMRGEPRPIEATGPREVEVAAAAFNQAIEDLVTLRRRLAASERIAAWREIARSVAHEIKNPLVPIRAAIETLRRLRARGDAAFDEYFDEATATALAEVNRIARIVSEFSEFARLPAPKLAPVDPIELTRSVVSLHKATGPSIEFLASPCPSVTADRDQIVQVLTNLVQNALDAVKDVPSPKVIVEVAPRAQDRVRIRVCDNGTGISAEMQARLFVPYATTKPNGTGLGLAIAQRLVVEHGGEIGFEAAPGGGTQFWFDLPTSSGTPPRDTDAPAI